MTHPRYTRLIDALPSTVPFVGPEAQERAAGRPFTARLGANENGFGPSPRAIAAMAAAAGDVWKYGDSTSFELRAALAAHHDVNVPNVLVGEGIDGLLGYLCRLLIEPGDAVVTSDGAYPTFNYHVAGFGGVLHKVPYSDDHEDLDALIAKAIETGAKLIYLANPDNPMGTWHGREAIEAMIKKVPDGTLLLLDEAYVEFAPEDTAARIAADDPRVIRMRTFSKAHGMAGARVGYAIAAPELIAAFDKIRNHFGMCRISQAGALAALQDTTWQAYMRLLVAGARQRIADIAAQNGLSTLPSATNFVAIDCGGDGDFARAVLTALGDAGVFVRMPFVAPENRCIRVSVGPEPELDRFAEALPHALEAARTSRMK
ncbi:histidinol-phosphate aminotransferase [Thioclava dalianensis]|uniref:Histidinol-phosphate aminotransferase n=1 Tax=Thioclava dalianensis TaxID=1185766 RepID=A0A074TH88_9RHOB|nr:pyridoxal phosphate-dependent aminotransferase [Thioclava dalianensis]KEP69520.1 histidinol-phosphate aminotransferase [Thioclava dalianensis]SFN67312.1 histidinol-phosphate aminotransferase [Thioclava dalianensis]